MKTLEEFDKERREHYEKIRAARKPHPNGIACPECGSELWDSNPPLVLASIPPQKNIHCPDCKYQGYRYA